jgi:hypothetical protein
MSNGAQALIQTLVNAGVDIGFTNPGTSEMHFVAALDEMARTCEVYCACIQARNTIRYQTTAQPTHCFRPMKMRWPRGGPLEPIGPDVEAHSVRLPLDRDGVVGFEDHRKNERPVCAASHAT